MQILEENVRAGVLAGIFTFLDAEVNFEESLIFLVVCVHNVLGGLISKFAFVQSTTLSATKDEQGVILGF